jgi:hypothetical protein
MKQYFSYEKWNIATTGSTLTELLNANWKTLSVVDHQNNWQNAADPFYLDDHIYFEEFSYYDEGKIVQLNLKTNQRQTVYSPGYHVSFPTQCEVGFMVESSSENVLTILDRNWDVIRTETVPSNSYLDPTIYTADGMKFLFCSKHGRQKHSVLHIYRLNSLGEWEAVVDEPICLSQFGGRMAGQIISDPDLGTIRFGQISSPKYGTAIAVYRITSLDEVSYSEELIGQIDPPKGFDGIHTINVCEQGYVVDLRRDKTFSMLKIFQLLKKRFKGSRSFSSMKIARR